MTYKSVFSGAEIDSRLSPATPTSRGTVKTSEFDPASYNSVGDMKSDAKLSVGQMVRTAGYYTPGDGGGNDYEIVAAGTGTDDGGSFIDLDNGLQAKRILPASDLLSYTPKSQNTLKADKIVSPSSADDSVKLIERLADDSCIIYSPKRIGGDLGYVGVYMRSGDTTTSNSAGGAAELLRATKVFEYREVVTWLNAVTSSVNTDIDAGGNSQNFESIISENGYTAARGTPVFYNQINSEGEIVYTIPGARRQRRANVAFVASTSSTAWGVSIEVNGIEVVADIGLQAPEPMLRVVSFDIPFSQRAGGADCEIKVKNASGGFAYVIGANFFYLSELPSPSILTDSFRAYGIDFTYRDSFGACDYAVYDADDDQWIGSYHGGETRNTISVELDGQIFDYMAMAKDSIKTFSTLVIAQETNINGKLQSRSHHEFLSRGSYLFRCHMVGDVTCSDFRTCMSTSDNAFDAVEYPRHLGPFSSTEEETHTIEDGQNIVVQSALDGGLRRRITIEYSHFASVDTQGAYIRATPGGYNKFYYGPVYESAKGVNIKEISFAAKHSYS